jgi:hypothetical protein
MGQTCDVGGGEVSCHYLLSSRTLPRTREAEGQIYEVVQEERLGEKNGTILGGLIRFTKHGEMDGVWELGD